MSQKSDLESKIASVLVRKDVVGMHAVGRALVHLTNRQTADEQLTETTRHDNGVGFRSNHGKVGVSMAKYYLRTGRLTEKQQAYWQRETASGTPRILIYRKQILEEALAKAALK